MSNKNKAKKVFEGAKKIRRLIEIMNILDSQREVSIKELCSRFNVSARTIERDINSIEMNYPINRGKKGYVSFMEGVGLKKKNLTYSQKAALLMTMQVAKNLGGYMDSSFSELIRHITDIEYCDTDIIPIMPARIDSADKSNMIEDIKNSISFNHVLKIKYICGNGKKEEKEICPLKILFSEGFLYILAFPYGKTKDYRTYRLDRILSAEIVNEKDFNTPQNIDKIIKAASIWGIRKGEKIKVELNIKDWAVDYFRNFRIIKDQKVKGNSDGSINVYGYINQFQEIIPQILRWIPCIKIIKPEELRNEIRKIVSNYLQKL